MPSNWWTARHGPYDYGGALYLVCPDNNKGLAGVAGDHTIRVWRSTDAGVTWTEQDGANRKACKYQPTAFERHGGHVIDVQADGATLHIGFFEQEATGSRANIHLTTFDMSANTWGSTIAGGPECWIIGGYPAVQDFCGFALVRLSSGTIECVYNGATELVGAVNYDRVSHARYTGGAWGAGTQIAGQSGVASHFAIFHGIRGLSDRAHYFIQRVPNAGPNTAVDLLHCAVVSGSPGALQDIVALAPGFQFVKAAAPVITPAGQITVPYVASSSHRPWVAQAASADVPSWSTTQVNSTANLHLGFGWYNIGLALAGSTLAYLWEVDTGTAYSVRYSFNTGSGWSAAVELFAPSGYQEVLGLAAQGFSGGVGIIYPDPDTAVGVSAGAALYYLLLVSEDGSFAYQE